MKLSYTSLVPRPHPNIEVGPRPHPNIEVGPRPYPKIRARPGMRLVLHRKTKYDFFSNDQFGINRFSNSPFLYV